MKENETFKMTYSAGECEEIEKIRKKYTPAEPDKMKRLRDLDASAGKKALTVFLALMIVGALVMGFGMSLAMTELGETLGMSEKISMTVGIAIGLAGIILLALSYPISNATLKRERKKIAPEIIRLSDELINNR